MNKLDVKDLQILGMCVSLGNDFLLGREEGRVLMDTKTIERIEGIMLAISLMGDSIACSGIFSHEQLMEAGREKADLMEEGQHVEDAILKAILLLRPKIMENIRARHREIEDMDINDIIKSLKKEVESEANNN